MGALESRHCCFLFIAVVFLITKVLCAICRKLGKYRKAQRRKITFIYHEREQWIIFWYMALEWFIHTHTYAHIFSPFPLPPHPESYFITWSIHSTISETINFLGKGLAALARQVVGAEVSMVGQVGREFLQERQGCWNGTALHCCCPQTFLNHVFG